MDVAQLVRLPNGGRERERERERVAQSCPDGCSPQWDLVNKEIYEVYNREVRQLGFEPKTQCL